MSLRSPLARVLGSGSAKEGTDHWWSQRVSAVALLILGLWILVSFARLDNFAYPTVHAWAGSPFNSVMLGLLGVTLAWHSTLGVEAVIEDYVHGSFIKVISLMFNNFIHAFLAIAGVFAVLKIAFGGNA